MTTFVWWYDALTSITSSCSTYDNCSICLLSLSPWLKHSWLHNALKLPFLSNCIASCGKVSINNRGDSTSAGNKKKIITTLLPSTWIMSRSSSNSSNEKVHRAVFQNSPTWNKENWVWISLLWTTHNNTIFWVWGRFSQSPSERVLFSCSACYSAYLTEAYWEWIWDGQRSCCKFQTRINKTKSCDCHQQNLII